MGGGVNLYEVISSVFLYKYYFPMWYMFQLMMFFLLSPIIHIFMKRRTYMTLLLISLIITSIFVTNTVSFVFYGLNRSAIQLNYLIYFLFGALVTKIDINISTIRLPHLVTCIMLFLVISFISSLCMDEYLSVGYKRILVPGVFVTFVVMMVKLVQQCTVKIDLLFGVSPMAIYGMHGFAGFVLVNLLNALGWGNSLTRYFIHCVLCVIVSFVLCCFFKLIFPKVYKLFIGNR